MECNYCENKCNIDERNHGICAMYSLGEDGIIPRHKNQVSTITIGRIEDVPILHFYPGSLTLLMGTVGCNFDCPYCQNSPVARSYDNNHFRFEFTPEQLVNKIHKEIPVIITYAKYICLIWYLLNMIKYHKILHAGQVTLKG